MVELVCWLKAAGLGICVALTFVGGVAAFMGAMIGIVWLTIKGLDALREHTRQTLERYVGWALLGALGLALLVGAYFGLIAAHQHVCMQGFVQTYKSVWTKK